MTERDLELLSAYLDSALTSDERAALETRLQGDAELRRELELLRETKLLIAALPQLRSPRSLTLTPAQVGQAQPRRSLLVSPWVSMASAAAAFLLFVSGFFSILSSRLPQAALVASAPTPIAIMTGTSASPMQELPTVTDVLPTEGPTEEEEAAMQAAAPVVVTGTPMPTLMPPSTADDAARGDGFAPMTFTPAAMDAANAIMESAPAGGFATEMQAPMATPAADLAMDATVPQNATTNVLADEAATPAADAEVFGSTSANEGTMMAEPTTTTLAYAATLPSSPASPQMPLPTAAPTQAAVLPTPQTSISAAERTAEQPFRDPVGISLIIAGMLFMFVAIATTIFRMRR